MATRHSSEHVWAPTAHFLQRVTHLGTDYAIEGELAGPILRIDEIQRASVTIAVNWNGSAFAGSLATNGTYDGGRETMKLTASDLVLRRALPIITSR